MKNNDTYIVENIGDVAIALKDIVKCYQKIFILTDTNTYIRCLPLLLAEIELGNYENIIIPNGDGNKTIASAVKIWKHLSANGATRHSLMLNLGGGMITDIGGFTASTFKRGMDYVNIATSLLGAVDAATGGKTGVNFEGFKNEVGVFAPAKKVVVGVDFFRSLDQTNLYSGYAEMLKHALIDSDEKLKQLLDFDLENVDYARLTTLLKDSLAVKERIVLEDPKEQGIRKALNFGHTFGHAFESLSYRQNRPLLHGYAVAFGIVAELYLSHTKMGFPKKKMERIKAFVQHNYGTYSVEKRYWNELKELMTHDKKNIDHRINFTLLSDVGNLEINETASENQIDEALQFTLEN